MSRSEVNVDGRPEFIWSGGAGDALLLLHGAWAGAEMHWAPVWNQFAAQRRVVAPDFPGLASDAPRVPRSFDEATRWVEHVLDATNTPETWVVGNSFGAALAARFASRFPERCLGLVLVDGGPAQPMPSVIRALVKRWPLRQMVEGIFRRSAYSASTLRRGFADPGRAPPEVRALAARRRPRQLEIVTEMILAGDPPVPPPKARTLLVWGAKDHLLGSTIKTGQRLERSLPNAELAVIPGAGHLPQVENPDEFVRIVRDFIDRTV